MLATAQEPTYVHDVTPLGSVSHGLLQASKVPVTIVKHADAGPAA